jgi:nicotinate (nicotinamide) nucleotide adenylyltransferase
MQFLRRAPGQAARIGILPGAFNPPTVAHLALAHSALAHADETLFVLPREFPHKPFAGAPFEARIEMLLAATAGTPRFSVAVSEAGLFRDIAGECREAYGEGARFSFLCGRDAAERILNWDYDGDASVAEMLREFDLLVAARRGELEAPLHLRHAIEQLHLSGDLDLVSSTEVRERIARGEPWEDLVPESVRKLVVEIYRPKRP